MIHEKLRSKGRVMMLDIETRWGSTYLMLKRLLELEDDVKVKDMSKKN